MAENIIFKKIGFYIVKNWSSNVKSMSQKSILSFFQKQSIATSTSTLKEKSPTIKKKFNIGSEKKVELLEVKKKRKRINLASDSEEEIINSSPERKKRSIEPTLNTPNNKNDESHNLNKQAMNELSKTEIEENGLNGDRNELPEQANGVNGNIETKENTEKPTLKTLSFLGSKKKQTKTPKKTTEKRNKKSEDNKTPGKKTPTKAKTSPSIKSEDETPSKKTPTKAKTSPSSTKKSPQKKKNVEKNNKKEISENLENKDKDDDKSKSNNEKAFLINKSLNNAESNTDYFPDKKNYHPINDASWKHGERVPYIALAKTLQKIEETSSRLKIIEILSNYLRSVLVLSPNDFLPSVYLCLNKLAPAYEGLELGIADMYLMKAVAQCTGRTNAQIKADVANTGDLGIVAEQSRSNQRIMFRPAPLTVQSVFNQLKTIAKFSGNAAMTKKVDIIEALFVACRECEARFVIRSLAGKMRIGLAEQSVLQAISLACTATPTNQEFPPKILNAADGISANEFKKKYDEQALILKTTFCECPDYNKIIPVLLEEGIEALPEKCKITPGLPVKPMLAQPTKGAREVLERFEGMKFTCEWKYDGERAQIHLMEDGKIKIYSRNQEDNTSKYPDIIKNLRKLITSEIKSFILDAEVVAWDNEQKKIKPFQILSTRKRKDAQENEIKVQVCVFMFDLLYFNGESLIQKPLIERRELLHSNFIMIEGKFMYVTSLDTNIMEEVQECLEESVKGNCEGLMVKTLDTEATYEIAKRSRNWLKLKKDYLEGVGDTLDLVVIGGYTGKGKRTGQYGGFLLASYDVDNEEYQAICKIGTGFTDEMLAQHAEFFKSHIILSAKSYYRYHSSLEPDHWFDAVQVWEVKCADLSLSPIYLAAIGLVDAEKGISLRFPRFLKIRDDKSVEQATSSQQVAEMYKNQDQIKNQGNTNANFNEEDF